jgi:hypothetical protein
MVDFGSECVKTSSRNKLEDMDWIDMAQDRDMWQAITNMVNIWV